MWDPLNGFVPRSFDEILAQMVESINQQYGTAYDSVTIQGTNFYKYFYAGIQVIMEAEQQVSDLSAKYQSYVARTNQRILQPRGTVDGFINFIASDGVLNTEGSFDPTDTPEKAGKIKFAVLLDMNDPQYAVKKAKLIEYFHKYLSVGLYYYSGVGEAFKGLWDAEVEYHINDLVEHDNLYFKALTDNTGIVPGVDETNWVRVESPENFVSGVYKAVNGQNFWYGFYLPRFYQLTSLNIELPISANNNEYVMTQKEVQDLFAARFEEYMKLGKNLELESICSVKEFPFASRVVYNGTYTDEHGGVHSFTNTPVDVDFDVKFRMMDPTNITVIYR